VVALASAGANTGLMLVFFMAPSAALFIDGSNFYHALKDEGQLPFDYDSLFSELDKLSPFCRALVLSRAF